MGHLTFWIHSWGLICLIFWITPLFFLLRLVLVCFDFDFKFQPFKPKCIDERIIFESLMINETSKRSPNHPTTTKQCQIPWSRAKHQNIAFEKWRGRRGRIHHNLAMVPATERGGFHGHLVEAVLPPGRSFSFTAIRFLCNFGCLVLRVCT